MTLTDPAHKRQPGFHHVIFTTAAAALLTAAWPALALEAANPPLARPIPIVQGAADFSAAQDSDEQKASAAFLRAIPSAPDFIFFDMTIVPVQAEGQAAETLDFHTKAKRLDGSDMPGVPCRSGAWAMIDRSLSSLVFTPEPLDPHLELTIDVSGATLAPYNAIACDHAPGLPNRVALRISGFFTVQGVNNSEKRQLRLVPVIPPYAEAIDALARSIAAP